MENGPAWAGINKEVRMGVRFKAVKKTSEPYYIVPDAVSQKTGILHISQSGICCLGDGTYGKAFVVNETTKKKASSIEKIKGSMMVLRGYDVPFKYLEYSTGEVILDINVSAKDFEEAKNIIGHLENDMKSSLHTFGILVDPMDLQDRLRFFHQRTMQEFTDARIDVNDYLKNTSWSADIDYKKFLESKKNLKTENGWKGYFYARKMPTENIGTLYDAIHGYKSVTDMMIDYEPVSDQDVHKKKLELYDDAALPSEPGTDERRYIMAGIYFSLSGTEESIQLDYEKLKESVYPYGCDITPFYFNQFKAFKAFATFTTKDIKQLRIAQVANAVNANPFNAEGKKPPEISILDAFDTLLNKSREG